MRKTPIYFLLLVVLISALSCRKSDGKPSSTAIGISDADLDANEEVVRKKEALLGNVIADAVKLYFINKGEEIDFVLINGGNIRFDSKLRPDGIYRQGVITVEMIEEMLPFGNSSVIVNLTGSELKEILERSVAQYPLAKGPFLQCSKEIRYKVDTLATPQILNIDETEIVNPGHRIDSIWVNGVSYDPLMQYRVIFSDYIGEGNDGYVTLRKIPQALKKYFSDNQTNAVKDYFQLNSPIKPQSEGRIMFK